MSTQIRREPFEKHIKRGTAMHFCEKNRVDNNNFKIFYVASWVDFPFIKGCLIKMSNLHSPILFSGIKFTAIGQLSHKWSVFWQNGLWGGGGGNEVHSNSDVISWRVKDFSSNQRRLFKQPPCSIVDNLIIFTLIGVLCKSRDALTSIRTNKLVITAAPQSTM